MNNDCFWGVQELGNVRRARIKSEEDPNRARIFIATRNSRNEFILRIVSKSLLSIERQQVSK